MSDRFQLSERGKHEQRGSEPLVESLENRRLLHGGMFGGGFHFSGGDDGGFGFGHGGNSITFSEAPAAVQMGLDNLAATDHLPAPTSSQTVFLSNVNGVERYSVDIVSTGTSSVLTVDQTGAPVTAPAKSTTTFSDLQTSAPAAANEITAIANALSLAVPAGTATVNVTTTAGGAVTYTVRLSSSSSTSTTTGRHSHGAIVSVDASGNPVGNQSLPFSVIPSAIQNGLNAHAPSGATPLSATSTQTVQVRTLNGVTTYSTVFSTTGTRTKVTVNAAGALVSLPSHTSTTFAALTLPAVQTELQTLANADGFSGTIPSTQPVDVFDEGNGTTISSVTLPVTKTDRNGNTFMINVTISVDQNGNPTTLPTDGSAAGDFHSGGFVRFGGGGRVIRFSF